ncbi:serine O-acetyltransferase [Candidatus Magnetominusculus xianensis]|uniref:Serine acetyltransferase n=1 Tax=Candidatus Magnetominusculus xianensis TaxID=1748249 RepID=A0ABR5SH37_9BACT|nr:hypothetical protein [Candidatus Magnetominusculus xianensis]KWT85306.1 serine acetyltransferase [Candidatus Magnetominusculus xianensis]MBF0404817.1 hypothetical protein [Nitrospirota bacterium]
MKFAELIRLIKSDFSRFEQSFRQRGHPYSKGRVLIESILFKAGFHSVLLYRISHWLYRNRHNYAAWFITRLNITLTGAEIEFNAQIGPGLFIAHPVGIVIGRGTTIGSHATIFQGVSFIVKSWHPDSIKKFPRVGDNCFFFANSTIIGDISIGNQCVAAAHTVVNKDMPDGSMALGVPAVIYPQRGQREIESWFK